MRQAIEALGDSMEASEVRAVGGARHDGWLQMKADTESACSTHEDE